MLSATVLKYIIDPFVYPKTKETQSNFHKNEQK